MDEALHCTRDFPGGDDDGYLPGGELEMIRRRSFFAGAAAGAPPLAIGIEIGFAALMTQGAARSA
jgi:hypothetical protein